MPDIGTTRNPAKPSFGERGGGWVVGQALLMIGWLVIPPLGHSLTPSIPMVVLAGVLFAIGAFTGLAGVRVLGKNRTPFPRPRGDSQLIQTGIYALIRHPLYASLMALSLGWACLWQSPMGAFLALLQAVFLDAKARREERWLGEQFPAYADYTEKVRRFIPWIY